MTEIPILFEDGEALVIDKPAGLPIERPRRGGGSLEDHFEALKLGFQRTPSRYTGSTPTPAAACCLRNPKSLKRFPKCFEDRGRETLSRRAVQVPADSEGRSNCRCPRSAARKRAGG